MSTPDNHGLTPTRPRVSVLEASLLEQIRDLRERVAALEARPVRHPLEACGQCSHQHAYASECRTVVLIRNGVSGEFYCGCAS